MPEWLIPILSLLATAALGVLTWTSTRKTGDRAELARKEARVDVLERRLARRNDYINTLRRLVDEAGVEVPPWPDDTLE